MVAAADDGVAPNADPARREGKRDAEQTKRDILTVAAAEFAEHGLTGTRVDEIAARMRTTKAMLYYYFKSKEGLYQAVLEAMYARIRATETDLQLDDLEPEAAMRRLVEVTFDCHEAHPDDVRLMMVENIHRATHLKRVADIGGANASAITVIAAILERGRTRGVFRRAINPVALHLLINSICVYRISNQHTFGALFGRDLWEGDGRNQFRRLAVDSIVGLLKSAE